MVRIHYRPPNSYFRAKNATTYVAAFFFCPPLASTYRTVIFIYPHHSFYKKTHRQLLRRHVFQQVYFLFNFSALFHIFLNEVCQFFF